MWIKGCTLSRKQFTELHSAMCRLYQDGDPRVEKMFEVLKPAMAEADQLSKAIGDYWHGVKTTHGFKTVWSIDDVAVDGNGDGMVPDCNSQHSFPPNATLKFDTFGDGVFEHQGMGTTWLDLYRIANDLIVESGDYHYFIEGFRPSKTDPLTYYLVVGS